MDQKVQIPPGQRGLAPRLVIPICGQEEEQEEFQTPLADKDKRRRKGERDKLQQIHQPTQEAEHRTRQKNSRRPGREPSRDIQTTTGLNPNQKPRSCGVFDLTRRVFLN